jgi:hypothetical protein
MEIDQADEAVRKRAIFDQLSPRRRKYIDKIGYDNWDPFEAPKDPIDIRKDTTNRTTQQLVREFLQNCGQKNYSNAYGRGVLEIALGIINKDDRFLGMYDFVRWYQQQLDLWENEKKET